MTVRYLFFLAQDFCPSLTAQVKPVKESVYKYSFSIDPSVPRPKPKSKKEWKKHTNDLRETHFCLGTWNIKNTSETKHSIGFDNNTGSEQHGGDSLLSSSSTFSCNSNSIVNRNRHESMVFRDGDWNRNDRESISSSVTQKDFADPPPRLSRDSSRLKFIKEFTKPKYHRATHFDLGNATSSIDASLYRRDFAAKPLTYASERDRACRKLGSNHTLELFPKDSRQSFITTKDTKYKDHGTDYMLSAMRDRNNELFSIKQRNERDSHQTYRHQMSSPSPTSSSFDNNHSRGGKLHIQGGLISVSSSDFRRFPLTVKKKCGDIKIPINNHLCGDYNGADARMSEAREKYTTHKSTSRQLHHECLKRRRDNKSTHFVLGSTDIQFPSTSTYSMSRPNRYSEQASQFRERPLLDPLARAAGKTMAKGKEYSHLLQQLTEGDGDGSRSKSSFMIDFKDPWEG